MPSYDYRCQSCRETFEIERSMNDDTQPACAHCGSGEVSRIFTVNVATGNRSGQGKGKDKVQQAPKPSGGHCCGGGCH
ncbi:MAG: zinc ribbon domain-containing protein [Candidatus Melainabacteria bacterium]|nr:zinc ribbon domain-containing protein [Candidatus Melainabacteria bacterium]